MFLTRALSSLCLLTLSASALPTTSEAEATVSACNALAGAFPAQLFWPNSTGYVTEATAIWSETCVLSPNCVFEPRDAPDVSAAVKIIKRSRSSFAIRSGGHMPVPGAQSTDTGVMISMSKINTRTLNADKSVASLGPGQTWGEVYSWIAQFGLAVNGGRYASVGVGGLLIGGGIGYFGSTRGWGCDGVVGYEIVLADGVIVNPTATNEYSDLFWALRGGHNNFGVVTRFDLKTFPLTSAYAGATIWKAEAAGQFFDALNAYIAPGGGVDDPNAAISPIVALTPADGVYEVISIEFYPGTNPSPQAFENFTKINAPFVLQNLGVRDSWTFLPLALDQFAMRNQRQLFWAVSFMPDPRAISIANRTVMDSALAELKGVNGLSITVTYQPISKAWLEAAKAAGGDVIDIDPSGGTFIAGLISTTWENEADDATVYAFSQKAAAQIEAKTKALKLFHPFVYINDAAKSQKPFNTLGAGNSLPKLKAIQRKYDPNGFIKKYLAHGFGLE